MKFKLPFLLICCATSNAYADVLNGGFEEGASGPYVINIPGWTVVPGSGLSCESGWPYGGASEGGKLVTFNNDGRAPGGVLYQDIDTSKESKYDLNFKFGNFGLNAGTQVLRIRVIDVESSTVLIDQSIVDAAPRIGMAVLRAFKYSFQALGSKTRISFSDTGSTNHGASDGLLDSVRVDGVAVHFELDSLLPSNVRLNTSVLTDIYKRSGGNLMPVPGSSDFLWFSTNKVKVWGNANRAVRLTIEPVALSGAHLHDDPKRLHGWLANGPLDIPSVVPYALSGIPGTRQFSTEANAFMMTLDSKGYGEAYYVAPELAATEVIIATDDLLPTFNAKDAVSVVFPIFSPLSSPNIDLVGDTTAHQGQGHHGTTGMNYALGQLAKVYYAQRAAKLGVNDMSLPFGGTFDIGPTVKHPEWKFWNYPHKGHKLGLEADLNVVYPDADFVNILKDQGVWINNDALWKSEGNHFHVNLSGTVGKLAVRPVKPNGAPVTLPLKATWDATANVWRVTSYVMNTGFYDYSSVKLTKAKGADQQTFQAVNIDLARLAVGVKKKVEVSFTATNASGQFPLTLTYAYASDQGSGNKTVVLQVSYGQ